jgi:hypothetical protein
MHGYILVLRGDTAGHFWPLLGAEKPLNGREMTCFGAKKPRFDVLGRNLGLGELSGFDGCFYDD